MAILKIIIFAIPLILLLGLLFIATFGAYVLYVAAISLLYAFKNKNKNAKKNKEEKETDA